MASVKILYFALLRDVTGKTTEDWREPAPTVGDLLRELAARYGHEFERWVLDDGDLGKFAIVLVNGHDVRQLQRLATPLASDDTVVIFPPVGGG
ncbi:MAG TPA: ubiquitin-like small modifier protein 1 [Candidatus Methylomirabilis sp.]|nr:ubiquitin-like small modifier protein 1 [Candidatus Methylomirabilis sp.]